MPRYCCYCRRFTHNLPVEAGQRKSLAGRKETRDHLIPASTASAPRHRYTVPCCRACNEVKGDMTMEQWDAFRTRVPKWWKLFEERGVRGVRLYFQTVGHEAQPYGERT